ncbi:MAG: ATP-dependent DNA helicase [bacterium]
MKQDLLKDLNSEQRRAVTHDKGPVLVIAGAGTGKTTVLIRRIAHLIAAKKAKPGEILALTFTDKAAEEMESRVDVLVPYGYIDVSISTFHAFGDRVLRDYAIDLGLRSDYRVLSLPEQLVFLREHLFELPLKHFKSLGDPTKHLAALVKVISRAQDEAISPPEYLKWARKTKNKEQLEVARIYDKYQKLKLQKGFVDFADQVGLVLQLFKKKPAALQEFQKRYKYILVDEFQDTNYAQFELLKLLAGKKANLTVVGDDDQSIYRFRGAAISNILNFEKTYKKCKKVVLTRNYRSSQVILDTSHRLIKFNNPDRLEVQAKINKKLKAEKKLPNKKVEHFHFDRISSEADWVAQVIKKGPPAGGQDKKYSDYAILVRANKNAEPFEQALRVAGIPYQFSGAGGLYYAPEVQLAISFLKTIGDLADSAALFHLAVSSVYQLDPLDLQKMNTFAKRRNYTLHQVFSDLESGQEEYRVLSDIKKKSAATVKKIMADIDSYLALAKEKSTGEVLYEFLTRSRYLKHLVDNESLENDHKIKNLAQFFDRVKEFGQIAEVDRVGEFIKYLEILREAGENPESSVVDQDADAVHILTIHKAKGLEFKNVFMVSLIAERFPVRQRKDPIPLPPGLVKESLPESDQHLQEERRLFYVGMTRAGAELYFSSSADCGGKRTRKVSQFVLEALDLPKIDIPITKRPPKNQIALFAPADLILPAPKKIGPGEIINLSFSQIGIYLSCPLKYKYTYIVNLPKLPGHQLVYGQVMHNAVKEYGLAKLHGRKFTAKDLLAALDDSWSSEGFISRQHEDQRLAVAKKALQRFFKNEQKQKRKIKYIEEAFSLPKDKILVKGRWDRVDETKDGVVMVDYKTSEVVDQEKADKNARDNLQLSIYALVWAEKFNDLPQAAELYYLDTGVIGSAQKTAKDIAKAWSKVQEVAEGIRAADYKAKSNYQTCSYCDYRGICPESSA